MLELRLLGQFEARLDGRVVTIPSRPSQSLLAYLVLTAGTAHRRERLGSLLWPDAEDNNARSYLRHALWRLRKAVEADLPEDAQYLLADEYTVAFNAQSAYWLDLALLERVTADSAASADQLVQALAEYRGELLPGFFDDWAVSERERVEAVYDGQMDRLLNHLIEDRRWPDVLDWAERWIASGHPCEPAFRALMVAHSELGDMARMGAAYRRCREALFAQVGAQPSQETRELFERLSRGERVLVRVSNGQAASDANMAELDEPPASGQPPFQGLQYFDERDANRFFGREEFVDRLVGRLQTERFLTVVGASGSGKSSVVRAGVVPRVRRIPLQRSDNGRSSGASPGWTVRVLTPTARPLEALATTLAGSARSPNASADLLDALGRDPRSLRLYLRRTLPRQGRTLLVIDQFEELFTLCRDPFEREAFVDNLLVASNDFDAPASVVLSLRADFYTHCAHHPDLCEALAHHQEYLGPMSVEDLRRTIEGPAELGGWTFEAGLVDLLLREVGDEPGALPLLSHALLETWRRRRGHRLTLRGYSDSGGVRGAIARSAEKVFRTAMSAEQQAIARRVLLRLTELGEGTQDTRRRAALAELATRPDDAAAVQQVLQILADARLVTLSEGTAEVAHEALIREWPTLRGWLDDDRAGLRLHHQLTEMTHQWTHYGHDPDLLYRGVRLAQTREWTEIHSDDLNPLEREFLDASVQLAEQEAADREAQRQRELEAARQIATAEQRRAAEQGRAAARLRRRALYLATALLFALVAAGAAVFFGDQARHSTLAAEANARNASARELAAAAASNLDVDPERSLLLALRSVETTFAVDGSVPVEAEEALHRALMASRVRLTLSGHTSEVISVAFSPDASMLATASQDATARVWDAATGRSLHTLAGHAAPLHGIAFSPDGRQVVTAADDHTARVWDLDRSAELTTLRGHTDAVEQALFSPDGRWVATASLDRTARVWDVASGEQVLTLAATEGLRAIAVSPDGRQLAAGGVRGRLTVWNIPSGSEALAWVDADSPDGTQNVAFSPDGTRLATTSSTGLGKVWAVANGRLVLTLAGHSNQVYAIAYNSDGTLLATAGLDRKAKVWDASTGRELITLSGHTAAVNGVAFSPAGSQLATASWDGTARVWDIGPPRELVGIAARGYGRVAFSPDGASLASGLIDGTVGVWDASNGHALRMLHGHTDAAIGVAYSPDGKHLASSSQDRTARVWDLASGRALYTLRNGLRLNGVGFSPDGKRLVAGGQDGTARIWDVTSGAELLTLRGHTAEVWGASFSPDGKRVLTTSYAPDQTARIWDAESGAELAVLRGHTDTVWHGAFSPDGGRIATASRDGSARVWDAVSARELMQLRDHTTTVVTVAFSPDGRRLASASLDDTAKLWDLETGRLLLTLAGSAGGLAGVAFGPDGTRLATAGPAGLRLYVLPIDELLSLGRSRLTRGWRIDECTRFLHLTPDACGTFAMAVVS